MIARILLAGPTGAGKTWWAREHGYTVAEWEMVRSEARFAALVASLADEDFLAVERCAPSIAAREHFAALAEAATIYVLPTPAHVCHERIEARGRLAVAHEHLAVDAWWAAYEPHPEHRPPPDWKKNAQ